jgi:cytochrome c5
MTVSWLRASVLVGLMVGLAACRPTPPAEQTGSDQAGGRSRAEELLLAAVSVGLPPEGVAPGDLPEPASVGAQLVAKYCAQCHALPAPTAHSATDWPGVVRRMWLRMDGLQPTHGIRAPLLAERVAMLEYLAQNGLRVSGTTLPPGAGREVFSEGCSQCHALPDPRQHSAQDWPSVFQRMERNMARMKVAPFTREQTTSILLYLQNVASQR